MLAPGVLRVRIRVQTNSVRYNLDIEPSDGPGGLTPQTANRTFAALYAKVRKTPSRPRSWANTSLLQLCSHLGVRGPASSVHLLGQPDTFLAAIECQIDIVYL
jgi:hypothetical protein